MKLRHRVLAMLALLSVITYMDRVCIGVAGDRISRDLRLTPQMWGWVLGSFTLGYSLFEVPSGMLGDRIGPARVLTRIVLWWSAFTSATGVMRNFPLLLATRFLFGVGEAGAYPNMSSAIARWFPATERGRAQGVVWMSSRLGGALAPPLVVTIQIAWGWRASFWCFGFLGVFWAAVWYLFFRHTSSKFFRHTSSKIDGISMHEVPNSETSEKRRVTPFPWHAAFGHGNLWAIMGMYHTYCWASHFYLSWLPMYLQRGRGFTEREMGWFSGLPLLVGAAANIFGGVLTDHLSRRFGVRVGRRAVGCVALLVAASLTVAAACTASKFGVLISLALGYGAMDTMVPSAWAVCLDVAKQNAGAVTAFMNMSGQIGAFLSSITFGYLIGRSHHYGQPLWVMSAMLVVSSLLFFCINPARQIGSETHPVRSTA